jgi:hypothetical protein
VKRQNPLNQLKHKEKLKMETKLQTLKNELKDLASQIKTAKQERKSVRFTGTRTIKSPNSWLTDAQYAFEVAKDLKEEFRSKHIAYCMIRGKEYEDIEKEVKSGNGPNWSLINRTVERYDFTPEEKAAFAERKVSEVA